MPALEAYFGMDEAQLGFSVSVVFIGSIIGALFGGYFSDRLGRRRVLFATALIFFLSAILTAIPQTITQFNVARFIGGVGIGISIPIAGVYLAEIAPARFRGRIVSLNQLVITFGILVSYVVGGYVAGLGSEALADQYFLAVGVRHGGFARAHLRRGLGADSRKPAMADTARTNRGSAGPS